jgi:hypothetical protein
MVDRFDGAAELLENANVCPVLSDPYRDGLLLLLLLLFFCRVEFTESGDIYGRVV